MTLLRAAAAIAGLLVVQAGACAAQDASKPGWFTPPPENKTARVTVDITQEPEVEAITIIAQRASRTWRTQLESEHLNDPMASDAARPRASFVPEPPHCNSALRTVGGQPAAPGDLMVGSGAGEC
jgi:hypothetical protein